MTNTTTFEFGPLQTKLLHVLRTTQERKYRGLMCHLHHGEYLYCVWGLIARSVLDCDMEWVEHIGVQRAVFIYKGERSRVTGPTKAMKDDMGMSYEGADQLMALNDNTHMTFVELADAIEADPTKFFERAA